MEKNVLQKQNIFQHFVHESIIILRKKKNFSLSKTHAFRNHHQAINELVTQFSYNSCKWLLFHHVKRRKSS